MYGYTCNPDCYGFGGYCGADTDKCLGEICPFIPAECRKCIECEECFDVLDGRELLDCQRRHGVAVESKIITVV